MDLWLRIYQNGFRPGQTTVSQILALRRIIEGVKENNLSCIITFIDFKKALDSIHRGKMLCIVKAYGIPESLVNTIEDIYSDTKTKILSPDGETEYFSITAGVLQGDTLAPYLFFIVMDYALRKALKGKEEELGFQLKRRQSRRVSPEVITDLDFADDIAFLSEQTTQAQEMLTRVEQASSEVGLRANGKKTKVLAYNTGGEINLKTTDGTTLEVVDDFKYLSS